MLKIKSEDRPIVESLYELTDAISKWGYPCRAATEESLIKLGQLSDGQKQIIHKYLQTTLEIVKAGKKASMHHMEAEKEHPEKDMVEKALEVFGLEIRDDFWKNVDREDMIELFNSEHVQIFRTLNFFKFSSYSLLDLLTNEWYVLWERPKVIVEKMLAVTAKVLSGESGGPIPMNIPDHILREIYRPADNLAAHTTRSTVVKNKIICPVYREGTTVIAGMIVNSAVKNIGNEEGAKKLAFL